MKKRAEKRQRPVPVDLGTVIVLGRPLRSHYDFDASENMCSFSVDAMLPLGWARKRDDSRSTIATTRATQQAALS